MSIALAGIAALGVSASLSPFVLKVIETRLMDEPNWRSSHTTPTPRGGGLVIAAGAVAGLLLLGPPWAAPLTGVLVGALGLAVLGLVDDVRSVPVAPRLAAQVAVAAVAALLLLDGAAWRPLLMVVVVVWLVGYTNAFNFMDGINGIAAAQLIVAGTAWAALGAVRSDDLMAGLGVITAAAALGFLPWNFPRPRFFMGDVGSYFSGGWLAAVAVVIIRLGGPWVAVIAPLGLFGADTVITLVGRVRRGERWDLPHRDHVYQRLVVGGWSHARTTLVYVALSAAIAAAGLAAGESPPVVGAALVVLGAGLTVAYLTLPRWQGRAR